MSRTMSAAVRVEDQRPPLARCDGAGGVDGGPRRATATRPELRELADQMRRCVVGATTASDLTTKVELGSRTARHVPRPWHMAARGTETPNSPRSASV